MPPRKTSYCYESKEVQLLNILRSGESVSAADLSENTGFTPTETAEAIKSLLKKNFLISDDGADSSKLQKIRLNATKGYVLGIEFKRSSARIAIANILAEIVKTATIQYTIGTDLSDVLEKTFQCVDHFFEELKIPREKLISISIGAPGFVDYKNGQMNYADTMKNWLKKSFVGEFIAHFEVPVILENDVNLICVGEHVKGAGAREGNMVTVWIGDGVGGGVILDNHLIRGASGIAGEIGYLEVSNSITSSVNLKHLYTNQKYIGDILSEDHLYNVLKIFLEFQSDSLDKSVDEYSLKELLALGDDGNRNVQEILDEYSFVLANLCTEVIKIINPNLIVLSGNILQNSDYIHFKTQQFVKNKMRDMPVDINSIVVGALDSNVAFMHGAVSLALQVVFKPSIIHRQITMVNID